MRTDSNGKPQPIIANDIERQAGLDRLYNSNIHKAPLDDPEGEATYTINKHHVYLCDPDHIDEDGSENTLKHVLIHEYAHVLNENVGHTPEWKLLFELLQEVADAEGWYNYKKPPELSTYCEARYAPDSDVSGD